MINKSDKGFTGKIIYPVIIRSSGGIKILYRAGARSILREGEDISLDIEAHERVIGYDILVKGRLVAKAPEYKDALETMKEYIDSNTGRLKGYGLEETVENSD